MKESQDKKLKLMNDIIKTNQRHIEHLKSMVEQLKKQVDFEQKQKEELAKENQQLRKQIAQMKQQTFTDSSTNQKAQSAFNLDELDPKAQRFTESDKKRTPLKKTDLKINVQQIQHVFLSQSHAPLTSVKKSTNYIHEINDPGRNELMKKSIIGESNKTIKETLQDQFNFDSAPNLEQQDVALFEQFYILGCQKKEFEEFDNDQSISEGILPASIIWRDCNSSDKPYEYILHEFAYPFGLKVEKIKISDSFRKLKEIMYSANKYELMDKFFIFTIKSEQKSESEIVKQCNPEQLLYGICLTVYDYIESTPQNIELTSKNRKKRLFWKYKKTYCFLTYFPFFELFQDILISIINMIKMSRINRFIQKSTEEYEVLKEIDGQNIIGELSQQIQEYLQQLRTVKINKFEQQLNIECSAGNLNYKIPRQESFQKEIKAWSASIALQLLSYRQFLTIFLSIMFEISVVFICQRKSVLTSIIHFFHHLLYPFSWSHPIIYTLPESLLTILDSPVPVIVGLQMDDSMIKEYQLSEMGDNLLFVIIDQEIKFHAKPMDLLKQLKTPYFDGKLNELERLMGSKPTLRNARQTRILSIDQSWRKSQEGKEADPVRPGRPGDQPEIHRDDGEDHQGVPHREAPQGAVQRGGDARKQQPQRQRVPEVLVQVFILCQWNQ